METVVASTRPQGMPTTELSSSGTNWATSGLTSAKGGDRESGTMSLASSSSCSSGDTVCQYPCVGQQYVRGVQVRPRV